MARLPSLARPISEDAFVREFAGEWSRVFNRLWQHQHRLYGRRIDVTFSDDLSLVHARNARRYAECEPNTLKFFFAHEVRTLPARNRLGLIAHEIGHALMGSKPHTERDADRAAEAVLGVRISYDRRWPGKGLQVGTRVGRTCSRDRRAR